MCTACLVSVHWRRLSCIFLAISCNVDQATEQGRRSLSERRKRIKLAKTKIPEYPWVFRHKRRLSRVPAPSALSPKSTFYPAGPLREESKTTRQPPSQGVLPGPVPLPLISL
ncbi:hypothetical protein Naga_100736g2 [Nannochloropsis gaditana]|uniref:Secreted protein n=1 Tax=Nannochloropsis gaditana TaxID=72520 RepID=W7TJS8_9STRA|nr:hypothetical protein Naga_100736g2 [Nannochloropsis gaditana]